jgi:hypothetical protein
MNVNKLLSAILMGQSITAFEDWFVKKEQNQIALDK